jgi:hypothetical protein
VKNLNKSKFFSGRNKSTLQSGNSSYHSIQNLLSSILLSKNVKIEIYSLMILHFVLCGCDDRSLTLREERCLRVFYSSVLRRIFGRNRDKVTGKWEKLLIEGRNELYS